MALKFFKNKSKLPSGGRPKPPSPTSIPSHFLCPISLDLMRDPITLPSGITFERSSIEAWFSSGHHTCPVTLHPVENDSRDIIPNLSIRRMIQEWCVSHRECVRTPDIPITSLQVADALAEISAACHHGDRALCADLVSMLKRIAEESERNRQCVSSIGAAPVLAAAFSKFKSEDFLSAIVGLSDKETLLQLASDESVKSIVHIMREGSLSGKLNAILILKGILAAVHETEQAEVVSRTEELIEQIVLHIKNPVCLRAAKAALVSAYYLSFTQPSKLAKTGIVPVLLDMLVDAEKSLCEKSLAVLNGVLDAEAGREMASGHALTVPLLVKKMFKISDLATELAVSGMWKLCKKRGNEEEVRRDRCAVEALKGGIFQKLLLLLQVGCSRSAKEKASDLLRILNRRRAAEECVESLDFKGLKRGL